MVKFYMLIGLPGSGKSEVARQLADSNTTILSSDAIRKEFYGDETIQDDPAKIFEEMQRRTIAALKDGKNIIYDATNISRKKRKHLLSSITIPCEKIAYVVWARYETCVARDTGRNRKQLVCDDAVFDPNLIMTLRADPDEKVITFTYDFNECGHPLNLPFEVQSVDFLVKFTEHDIHICAFAEPCDDIGEQYDDYTNDMNDVEFDVRMTVEEKYALMLALFLPLLAKVKTKEKTPEPKRGSAAASTNQERMSEGQKKLMNTMSDLFPNIFKSNKDN